MSCNTVFFFLIQGGQTPLHYAARWSPSEVVTKLLESGADLNVKDDVRKLLSLTLLEGFMLKVCL